MTLGERLLAIRKEREMGLAEVYATSGVSKGFVSQLERDMQLPGVDTLERLADCYGMSLCELLRDVRIVPHVADYSI